MDPLTDVVPIPPGACLGLDNHVAMTWDAVRSLLTNMEETETQHALALSQCEHRVRMAEAREKHALEAAASADWWSRYGIFIGAAGGIVVGGASVALIFRLEGSR